MDPKSKAYLENFLSSQPAEDRLQKAKADSYYFCSDEESANHLATLVVQGIKQATASLLWSYEADNEPLPEVGQLSVITNWDGDPQCIVEVTDVEVKPYNEVTAEFAFIEGEGDKSLEYWRRVHWDFFSLECAGLGKKPSKDMLVILEQFKVIWKEKRRGSFMEPTVIAVSRSASHTFSKPNREMIQLIAGQGVEDDAHSGKTVKHRFLMKKDATRPNIRQIHLIHAELLDQLEEKGYSVKPGELGENITTRGIDLLNLPTGTILNVGSDVVIEVTALRNPCKQIDEFQKGLLKEVLYKDEEGNLIRKTGVMGIILQSGAIQPGDNIIVELPPEPHHELEYVW